MEELLNQYEQYCIGHKENSTKDSELANSFYQKLISIFKTLKARDELYKLKAFLHHPHDGVKAWASTHYLLVDELEAKKSLSELISKGGLQGLSSETVIKEWDSGKLKSYYLNL
jgi:hypothetical protein